MARLLPDGTAEVGSAASDMGPGTWTSMTQVAADAFGLPIERVTFTLGDTRLPKTPPHRSEEHTSELQSLMRISYAVFCLKKQNNYTISTNNNTPKAE